MKIECSVKAINSNGSVVFEDEFYCDKPFPLCDRFIDVHRALVTLFGNNININYFVYPVFEENENK